MMALSFSIEIKEVEGGQVRRARGGIRSVVLRTADRCAWVRADLVRCFANECHPSPMPIRSASTGRLLTCGKIRRGLGEDQVRTIR